MIKAVIFDMYETLITHYDSPLYFGMQMAEDAGLTTEEFRGIWRATERERSTGVISLEAIVERILKENNCYNKETHNLIVNKRYAMCRECYNHLNGEIIPMLESLKKMGVKIGLISNCFSEEAQVIKESVLFPYFDAVCLSYEEHVAKPDTDIFTRCLFKLGLDAGECMYVGDGGSYELETARQVGMRACQACWYFKAGTYQPCGRKKDYEQLDNPLAIIDLVQENR